MKSNIVSAVQTFAAKGWKPALLATLLLGFAAVSTTVQAGGDVNSGNRSDRQIDRQGLGPSEAECNIHPGVLPPRLHPLGKSYGEWSIARWQWALAPPAAINPVLDSTGEFGAVGQSGPVWFLAGTFGGTAERSCTVPVGKALFFPVVNTILGAGVYDCEPSVPGVTCDVPTLQAKARASIDQAALLEVEVDGVALPNLFNYRAASPRPFSITVADGNVLGLDAGTYAPQVCDGYWLMLAPPWPGQHTVHFKAVNKDGKLAQEVTYHLTVACNPGVIPPEWPVFGKSYGEWGAAWWQWALGQPTAVNPVLDTTGRFAGVGQSGLVWFLAGTFGGPATRTCTVPEGKMLFFPVVNTILGAGVFDCNPSVPGVPCDVPVLQGKAKAAIDKVTHLEVKVDGVSVEDLFSYSAASPHPFSLKLPDGNVLGLPAGTYVPQVCDGYWLMLAPLSHGKHTIHFKSEGYASVDVTYYLTVQHSGR